jgi:hypothetical protein
MVNVKNYMEGMVRREVSSFRWTSPDEKFKPCWCELCAADIISLSLTRLPPLYCMEHSYGLMEKKILPGSVGTSVQAAMKRVTMRPKHQPGRNPGVNRVRVVNFAFEEGVSLVRAIMMLNPSACTCPPWPMP